MKYWEIIADRLSKAGWSWAVSQPLIFRGEQFGLQTHTATTESVSFVRADDNLTAFLELEIATGDQRNGFLGKGVFRAWGRTYDLKFPR